MDVKTRFVTSTAISEIQLKPHLLKSTLRHTHTTQDLMDTQLNKLDFQNSRITPNVKKRI